MLNAIREHHKDKKRYINNTSSRLRAQSFFIHNEQHITHMHLKIDGMKTL